MPRKCAGKLGIQEIRSARQTRGPGNGPTTQKEALRARRRACTYANGCGSSIPRGHLCRARGTSPERACERALWVAAALTRPRLRRRWLGELLFPRRAAGDRPMRLAPQGARNPIPRRGRRCCRRTCSSCSAQSPGELRRCAVQTRARAQLILPRIRLQLARRAGDVERRAKKQHIIRRGYQP